MINQVPLTIKIIEVIKIMFISIDLLAPHSRLLAAPVAVKKGLLPSMQLVVPIDFVLPKILVVQLGKSYFLFPEHPETKNPGCLNIGTFFVAFGKLSL